jgi:hypothetical protein
VVLAADSITKYTSLYVYYDSSYQQSAAADDSEILPLIDLLVSEIDTTGYNVDVEVIDAKGLANLLRQEPANDSALIVPTGAFPDTVYTKDINIVKPWIIDGGTLFWIGSNFGYFSSQMKTSNLDDTDLSHPKHNGTVDFFGRQVIGENSWNATAQYESQYSDTLSLDYSSVARAVSVGAVKSYGGLVLGKTSDSYTSIANIPLGLGRIVIFGGMMNGPGYASSSDQLTIAKDILQIMKSGALTTKGVILSESITLGANEEKVEWINIYDNNRSEHLKTRFVILYLYESNPTNEGKYFKSLYFGMQARPNMVDD